MSNLESMISVAEARQLHENWQNTRAGLIKDGLGEEDAQEFLFSLSELEDFLQHVKANSSVLNPGIRVYFGAYSNDEGNKATVFLAPTKGANVNSENDYSISPINRGMAGWPPKPY